MSVAAVSGYWTMAPGGAGSRRRPWAAAILVSAVHGAALAMFWEASANSAADVGAPQVLRVSWVAAVAPASAVGPDPVAQPAPSRRRAGLTQVPLPATAADRQPSALAPADPVPAEGVAASDALPSPSAAPAAPFSPPRFEAAYLSNPAPAYPAGSRARGEQGKVLLRVFVTARGEAGEVLLHAGSAFDRLDQAAVDAVRRWKFVPARRGEEMVAAWVDVPISFNLRR